MLTQSVLKELLSYDPETGFFTWMPGHREIGVAGFNKGKGYMGLCIMGKRYRAHRVAWLYMTGEWPESQIDHINRNRSDNRFSNLRLATNKQNQFNASLRKDNKTGFKGVFEHRKSLGRYMTSLRVDGRLIYLGFFSNKIDAAICYNMNAAHLCGDFAKLNDIPLGEYIHD